MVGMGSITDDVRAVLPHLRAQGLKVGVVSVKLLQPFPEAELVAAIRIAAGGGYYLPPGMAPGNLLHGASGDTPPTWKRLTEREWHILRLIVKGISLTDIGEQLCLSVKTVSSYRGRVLVKLGLQSNVDLVRYCIDHGIGE